MWMFQNEKMGKAKGNSRSMRNAIPIFIVRAEVVASVLKKTPWGQLNITCLCPKTPVWPVTFFGHFPMHSQHAMQRRGSIVTYAVVAIRFLSQILQQCQYKFLPVFSPWSLSVRL